MSVAVLDSLKAFGKQISWIRALNGQYKSAKLKREYERTVAYYARLNEPGNGRAKAMNETQGGRQWFRQGHPRRIFFLGTDELQDRGGILQALARAGELTCFTRADGNYGQNYSGLRSEQRRANSERLLALFEELRAEERIPDMLIAQTWAGYVDPKVLSRVREKYGSLIVNIGMDDRHRYWGEKVNGEWLGTYGLIPSLDLALTAAPECVEWYQKDGCPALFFPEASDPNIFRPMPELPKIHDVCFVGSRYGIRGKLVIALRRAGVRVTAYGSGWEEGRLGMAEMPRLFAQSKIILGVGTIGHCDDFFALKMRDFDGPMSGSFYLTHDNADLYPLFKVGQEIDTYRSIAECVQKVKAYLGDDDRREQIAQAGRMRALRDHTWDKRFEELFVTLQKLSNDSSEEVYGTRNG